MSILPERLPHTLDGPAQASPDGVHRFDPAPNRNACGLAAASVCLAIATVMVMLRAYSRLFCSRKLGIEDGMCSNLVVINVLYYGKLTPFRSPSTRRPRTYWICKGLLSSGLTSSTLNLELSTDNASRRLRQRGPAVPEPGPLGASMGRAGT